MIRVSFLLLFFSIPQLSIASEDEIYFELLSLSSYEIPLEKNSCEVKKNGYRVGDFLASYLLFITQDPPRTTSGLSCNKDKGVNCSFSYGQKAKWLGNESWNSVLRFKYDFESKKIDETTIVCIDIP